MGAINIGDKARVGAGSVVVTDVPPNATVVGVPGRIGLGFSAKNRDTSHFLKLGRSVEF